MKCATCSQTVPPSERNCPACGADAGFPNVRLAETALEKSALAKRIADADVSAHARGCESVLREFGNYVSNSKVVIARSLNLIQELLQSENSLYVSYYKQIQAGSRIPEQNQWDKGRTAADSTVSPHYHAELVYGALSGNGIGVKAFGPYSIVLREEMIRLRTTVFEENPFVFCSRQKINAGQAAPAGFRATWQERHLLAKAKLHSRLNGSSQISDFADILLLNSGGAETDFIEAHVFGAIHRAAIERVIGPKPNGGAQLVIWRGIEKKLKSIGAVLEVH